MLVLLSKLRYRPIWEQIGTSETTAALEKLPKAEFEGGDGKGGGPGFASDCLSEAIPASDPKSKTANAVKARIRAIFL